MITGPLVDAGVAGSSEAFPGPTVAIAASAGQAVIVCGIVFSTAASPKLTGITDNAGGNTWVFSTSVAQSPPYEQFNAPVSAGIAIIFIGWCLSLVNSITSVSVADTNTGDNSDFWRISVSSWSGIVVADNGAGNEFASTSVPASTVNLRNSGDLVIGVSNDDSAAYTGSPAGFTEFAGAGSVRNIGYMTPGTTGNFTATWTLGAADVAASVVQAFSPAALGAGGTVSPMIAREVMTDITQTATYQVVYEDELLWE